MAFTEEDLQRLEQENMQLREGSHKANMALASSIASKDVNNLVELQLDCAETLGQIEHFLRGDYLHTDPKGNQAWKSHTNPDLIPLNDYGVNCIMATLSNYIHPGTSLSYYQVERINDIMADLGDELVVFILCNYEKMGLNTQAKKSRFNLIVVNLLHIVETHYRRSVNGMTVQKINDTNINIPNGGGMGFNPSGGGMMSQPKKQFHLFKPSTW